MMMNTDIGLFLNKKKLFKSDCKVTTHSSRVPPAAYNLDENDLDKFWGLYHDMNYKNTSTSSCTLLEMPRDFSPLRLDFDFKFNIWLERVILERALEFSIGQHHNEASGIKHSRIQRGRNAIEFYVFFTLCALITIRVRYLVIRMAYSSRLSTLVELPQSQDVRFAERLSKELESNG